MLKLISLLVVILLLPLQLLAEDLDEKRPPDWETDITWAMDATPLDLAISLDQRKAFILGDDNKIHIFSTDGEKLGEIPVEPGVSNITVSPRGERIFLTNKAQKTYSAISISFPVNINVSKAPFIGNANAPVNMVVFSDFQCPYCGQLQPMVELLLEKNQDNLKVYFKHMPLNIHKYARPAALAAIAAQKQGKFWQMHDALFAEKELSEEKITAAAQSIGLDMNKFEKDKKSTSARKQLEGDMRDASRADVMGTPTIFINGRRVMKRDMETMQEMINRELQAKQTDTSNRQE